MPAEYDDTNRGVLFRNDRKESEKHPDYTGSLNVEGADYQLSAWLREDKKGRKYLSLSIRQREETKKPSRDPNRTLPPGKPAAELADDLEF